MRMVLGWRLSVLLLASALILGAPTLGRSQPPGGSIAVAFGVKLDTFNPPLISSLTTAGIATQIFETLVTLDDSGKAVPLLAERWTTSSDGRMWTFYLRKGVKFHDGAPFDAKSVAANFKHLLDPKLKYGRAAPFNVITEAEVAGEHVVKFHLSERFGLLPAYLTYFPAGQISPAALAKGPQFIALNPVGTGPFKLERFVPGEEFTVVRNEGYWGEKAQLARIRFVTIPEAGARAAAAEAGDIQVAIGLPSQFERSVRANQNLVWRADKGGRFLYVGINMFRPEFQDIRVRQAMNLAVDRDAIIRNFLGGFGRKARSYTQSAAFGFVPVSEFPHNPSRAAALLQEAGWTKGPGGVLVNRSGDRFPPIVLRAFEGRVVGDLRAAQAVAGYLQEVGLPVTVRQLEFNVAWSEALKPENKTPEAFAQLGLASIGNPWLDASYTLALFDIRRGDANSAFFWYRDQDIWPYVDTMLQQQNPMIRLAAMKKAQELLVEKAVWIPLYEADQTAAVSRRLKDLRVTAGEVYDFTRASFTR